MKVTQRKSWTGRCLHVAPLVGTIALALGGPLSAHEHFVPEPPAGAQVNAEGRPQSNPRPQASSGAPAMDPSRPAEVRLVDGKVKRMEAAQPVPHTGTLQRAVDPNRARAPATGSGPQLGRAVAAAATSHLHLVLRVNEGGQTEVVSATEVKGAPVTSDEATGSYIYEISSGGQTLTVGSLIDPFELRGFPGPEGGSAPQGHMIGRAHSATVVVQVPIGLASPAVRDLTFTLYALKEGNRVDRLDTSVLRELKQQGKLERKAQTPRGALGSEITLKGKRQP